MPDDTKKYSPHPCDRCGQKKVSVYLEDEPDGCGTYYEITCDACGYAYKTDGPDA